MATTPKTRVALLALTALCGCSPSPAQERAASVPTPEHDEPPLSLGALTELVPAAGLRWMVLARPRKISENAYLRAALSRLLPAERLDAFAADTAVDLATLPHALVAGYDLGTLYLAELPAPTGHQALERFIERLAGRAVIEKPHPRVVRASGTLDGIPRGFVDLDGRVVGVSIADLTLSRAAVGFATRRLKKSVPALKGAALSTLPAEAPADVVFYAPGPFDDAHGVLSAALAVSVRAEPAADGFVRLIATLSGEWEPDADGAARALESAFEELVSSPTGKLLELERSRALSVTAHPQYLTLSTEVALDPLVRGLRAAVTADVREILDLPPPDHERDAESH